MAHWPISQYYHLYNSLDCFLLIQKQYTIRATPNLLGKLRVGKDHVLVDRDRVEVIANKRL